MTPESLRWASSSRFNCQQMSASDSSGRFALNAELGAEQESLSIVVTAPSGFRSAHALDVIVDRSKPTIALAEEFPRLTASETLFVKGQVANAAGIAAWGYGGQTLQRGDWVDGKASVNAADHLHHVLHPYRRLPGAVRGAGAGQAGVARAGRVRADQGVARRRTYP